MLGTNTNVPTIAITPEAEEDDDYNYLSLVEALTDTEVLDDTDIAVNQNSKRAKGKPSKLKIKLDGTATDVEDMEVSDDDFCEPFLKDTYVSPTTDFGVLKETHKMKTKNNKGKKMLHTQSSTTNQPLFDYINEPSINEVNTDYEDCYASDSDVNSIPEIVLTDYFLESSKVFDRNTTENSKGSPAVTPCVSDNEACMQKSKPKYLNATVKSDKNDITDIENLETESDDAAASKTCNKKVRRKKPKQKTKSKSLLVSNVEDEGLTETEDFDDPNLSACLEADIVPSISSDFKIQFVGQSKVELSIPRVDEDPHTDLEALDSSEEEKEYKGIQLAVVRKVPKDSDTDEEVVSDNERYRKSPSFQDLVLPKPYRKMISVTEKNNIPSIRFNMSDNDEEVGWYATYEGPATDEECFSDTEGLLYAGTLSRGPTPEMSIFDYGFEDSKETLKMRDFHLQSTSSSIVEALTDTEEITLLNKRLAKKSKKFGSTLQIAQRDENPHTDTEDLFVADDKDFLVVNNEKCDDLTDVENMVVSDEEECGNDESNRVFSVTPTCMREMEGETILSRDGDGSFSNKMRLDINRRVLRVSDAPVSPMVTDTEEAVASGDDDLAGDTRGNEIPKELNDNSSKVFNQSNSKFKIDPSDPVLYLRGGYYREVHTDIEDMDMSDSEEHECKFIKKVSVDILGEDKVLLSTKSMCLDWKSCPSAVDLKNRKGNIQKVDASDCLQLLAEPIKAKICTTEFVVKINSRPNTLITILYWEIPFNLSVPNTENAIYLVGNTTLIKELPITEEKEELSKDDIFSLVKEKLQGKRYSIDLTIGENKFEFDVEHICNFLQQKGI